MRMNPRIGLLWIVHLIVGIFGCGLFAIIPPTFAIIPPTASHLACTKSRRLISTFPPSVNWHGGSSARRCSRTGSAGDRPLAAAPESTAASAGVSAGLRHSDGAVTDPRTARSADEKGHVHSTTTGRR